MKTEPGQSGKAGLALGLGALLSGLAASLCCVGPLVFAALGLGTFGLAAFFDRARPLLALALVVFGALGLYATHRTRQVLCEDGSCRTQRASAWSRWILRLLTLAGLALYLVPHFL